MAITPELLRDARQFASYTQAELAEALGVSTRTIVNWESEQGLGVPRKNERRVLSVLGDAIRMVQSMPPMPTWPEVISKTDLTDIYVVEPDPYPIGDERGARYRRRRAALEDFTDLDLIIELRDRARDRGDKATDWSTEAVDARSNVGDLTEDDVHVTPEGPKSGYALAARRGTKKANQPYAE